MFLVPMRGSEFAVVDGRANRTLFLIPMRGSEDAVARSIKDFGFRFLIPMRGSEIRQLAIPEKPCGVSDPHEG